MREIIFRAWDKRRSEYLSGGQILIAVLTGSNPKHNPIYLDILENADFYKERFILEQFTGIYDKNGKEIYEGDIVNCREYECYGKIEWNEDSASFYFCVFVDTNCFDEECLYDFVDELEVIGDIHNNAEMFTKQN